MKLDDNLPVTPNKTTTPHIHKRYDSQSCFASLEVQVTQFND